MDAARRKKLLPRGAQERYAKSSTNAAGLISEVLNGKAAPTPRARKIAAALARRMVGKPAAEKVFPEYFQKAS